MIYQLIRVPINFALSQFFSTIRIRGEEVCEDSPVLIVANHPNLALDSLIVGSIFKRELWFLAKSTLFRNPLLKKFFTACHMVPVFRKMDHADGAPSNDETFRVVAETLCSGKGVVIFPEGQSVGERKLSPIKTGAARIAFQAEEARDFKLGLKIQPVGLTYSELDKFRGRVTVTVGKAISVSEFNSMYSSDAIGAVKELTEKIESGLREVTVEVGDLKHTELIEKITALYHSRPSALEEPAIMQIVVENVKVLSKQDPGLALQIGNRIDEYLALESLFSMPQGSAFERASSPVWGALYVPIVLAGSLLNYVPFKLVGRLVSNKSYQPVYQASIKLGVGFLVFSVWHLALAILVGLCSGSFLMAIAALIFMIWLGTFTNRHISHAKLWALSYLWPGKKTPIEVLQLVRDQIIKELDALRVC